MAFVRVYTGDDGKSHFEELDRQHPDVEKYLRSSNSTVTFCRRPLGHFEDWHTTPIRTYDMAVSGGQMETGTADGVRLFGPGDGVMFEDVGGQGHTTRTVGGDRWYVTIRCAEHII